MAMASGRIRNMDDPIDYGTIRWKVPEVVISELRRLSSNPAKSFLALRALELASDMDCVKIGGTYADDAIVDHIQNTGGCVATIDRSLKQRIRKAGGQLITLHDDRIVLTH